MVGATVRAEAGQGRRPSCSGAGDEGPHVGTPGPTQLLAARLALVLEGEESMQRRICQARTSVEIRIEDGLGSVTLLLDRFPPRVVNGPEPAAIVIAVSAVQADELTRGVLHLPNEVSSGTVQFRGPVRRFLAIEPILRRRLGDVA